MYAILVIQLNYSPEYVLDKMELYEAQVALKYGYYASKDTWEANRLVAYIIAQVNSKKRLKIEDIIKFPWENEDIEKVQPTSKADLERMRKKAENYLKHNNI